VPQHPSNGGHIVKEAEKLEIVSIDASEQSHDFEDHDT
jgi:hypothetical protein